MGQPQQTMFDLAKLYQSCRLSILQFDGIRLTTCLSRTMYLKSWQTEWRIANHEKTVPQEQASTILPTRFGQECLPKYIGQIRSPCKLLIHYKSSRQRFFFLFSGQKYSLTIHVNRLRDRLPAGNSQEKSDLIFSHKWKRSVDEILLFFFGENKAWHFLGIRQFA